jgi:hypothetical protein
VVNSAVNFSLVKATLLQKTEPAPGPTVAPRSVTDSALTFIAVGTVIRRKNFAPRFSAVSRKL